MRTGPIFYFQPDTSVQKPLLVHAGGRCVEAMQKCIDFNNSVPRERRDDTNHLATSVVPTTEALIHRSVIGCRRSRIAWAPLLTNAQLSVRHAEILRRPPRFRCGVRPEKRWRTPRRNAVRIPPETSAGLFGSCDALPLFFPQPTFRKSAPFSAVIPEKFRTFARSKTNQRV